MATTSELGSPTASLAVRRRTVDAVWRALRREVNSLQRWPDLLWQQLHNRLQWEGEPTLGLLEGERALRGAAARSRWMRTRTPFRESRGLLRTLEGHTGAIHACAVSPDGGIIVSASDDNTLKLWDPATGAQIRTLKGHRSSVRGCAVSLDGAFVVSSSDDQTLNLWDPATGGVLRTLDCQSGTVWGCAVAPDGSFLVSVHTDKIHSAVNIWDPVTGLKLGTFQEQTNGAPFPACAVSPDGSYVVWTGSVPANAGLVRSWFITFTLGGGISPVQSKDDWGELSLRADADVRSLAGHDRKRQALGCAVSPDGTFVASAGEDGVLKIWDPVKGEELHTLEGHAGPVNACAVAPDGSLVVSASDDQTVKLWDPSTGDELRTMYGHTGPVSSCAIAPDLSFVVSGGADRTLKVWDPFTVERRSSQAGHTGAVNDCAIAPDGSFVVSASDDETLKLWDPSTAEQPPADEGADHNTIRPRDSRPLRGCAVAPDGSFIIAVSQDKTVKLWERSGEELATFPCAPYGVVGARDPRTTAKDELEALRNMYGQRRFKLNLDYLKHKRLVRSNVKNDVRFYDQLRTKHGHWGAVNACAVAQDWSFVVSASDDHTLKLWDLRRRRGHIEIGLGAQLLGTLEGHTGPVLDCAVSPDVSFVVSASADKTLRLWDAATGEQLQSLLGHAGPVNGCGVAPDGSFVVSASGDGNLKLWDPAGGDELATLEGHAGPVNDCAVTPDGSYVVSAGDDRTVRVWEPFTGRVIASLPLLGAANSVAMHPRIPVAVCGDPGGSIYLVDIVGVEYGPIVVTPHAPLKGPVVRDWKSSRVLHGAEASKGDPLIRCPGCFREHSVQESWGGEVIACPTTECGEELRVNPRNPRAGQRRRTRRPVRVLQWH
jgi:WD40 repeat protein